MPPKTKTKKKTKKGKTKSSKCKCSSQIQNTKVTVGGGGGGGSPIVYATYAPPPPQMPTSMPYETGRGFPPEKFERTLLNDHGVNTSQGNYSSNAPQAHSDMSILEKYYHEADAAKPQSYAGHSNATMHEEPYSAKTPSHASMPTSMSVDSSKLSMRSIPTPPLDTAVQLVHLL